MHEAGLVVTQTDKVLQLELHRPEKRNALSAALCNAIAQEVLAAPEKGVRAVLISGAGTAFCAGAELAGEGVYGGNFHDALFGMFRAIVQSPIAVIANVQGPAVGAGTQLSLACDFRVVGERAWFKVPATELGFALDAWTVRRAKDLLGGSIARNVLIGAQRVDAAAALAHGFAVRGGDDADALAFAQEVASLAPLAVQQLKQALNADDVTYRFTDEQQALYDACWASEDAAEARQARAEKRQPNFQGR